MMTGELEFDEYFEWRSSANEFAAGTTQILFILFLVFVSIVIANLLIALTLSKTEDVAKEATVLRYFSHLLKFLKKVSELHFLYSSDWNKRYIQFPDLKELFKV